MEEEVETEKDFMKNLNQKFPQTQDTNYIG